eukprot:SAG31_NODE_5039_length_2782_cov_1.722326_3_plen_161_part_00
MILQCRLIISLARRKGHLGAAAAVFGALAGQDFREGSAEAGDAWKALMKYARADGSRPSFQSCPSATLYPLATRRCCWLSRFSASLSVRIVTLQSAPAWKVRSKSVGISTAPAISVYRMPYQQSFRCGTGRASLAQRLGVVMMRRRKRSSTAAKQRLSEV